MSYRCLICRERVTKEVAAQRRPVTIGMCPTCAIGVLRKALGDCGDCLPRHNP